LINKIINKIIELFRDYRRVLSVAKKPTLTELKNTIRVCGMGIFFVGFIGFIFFLAFSIGGGT